MKGILLKRILAAMLATGLCLSLAGCGLRQWADAQAERLAQEIVRREQERLAHPEAGDYYCEELDATLTFGERDFIQYADGSQEQLLRTRHSANFVTESQQLRAEYRWDRKPTRWSW